MRWTMLCGVLVLSIGCDDKPNDDGAAEESADDAAKEKAKVAKKRLKKERRKKQADAETRCDALGEACGNKDKHKRTIAEECKQPIAAQVKAGCIEKVVAALSCFERDICSGKEAVQVYDDFRVLTARHKKCADELKAMADCMAQGADDDKP